MAPSTEKNERLQAVFSKLKAILESHAENLQIDCDTSSEYLLNSRKLEKGKPVFFGRAKIGSTRVAYHLMPVYCYPELLSGMSEQLRKRMQGKSCFNFTRFDPDLFEELAELTRKGLEAYQTHGQI
jgi:hypothetical protein